MMSARDLAGRLAQLEQELDLSEAEVRTAAETIYEREGVVEVARRSLDEAERAHHNAQAARQRARENLEAARLAYYTVTHQEKEETPQ